MIPHELIKIPARAIHPLLIDLVNIKNELGELAIPLITLVLHNGNQYKGKLIDAKFRNDALDVLLSLQERERDSNKQEINIMYLEGHTVAGLIIHDPETIAEFLVTENLSKLLPGGSTKMDLKKKLAQVSEDLTTNTGKTIACDLNWEKLTQDEKQYAQVLFFISETHRIILKMLEDNLAKQTIVEQIDKVYFQFNDANTAPTVSLDNKSLVLISPIKVNRTNNYQLRQLIESVL